MNFCHYSVGLRDFGVLIRLQMGAGDYVSPHNHVCIRTTEHINSQLLWKATWYFRRSCKKTSTHDHFKILNV